MSWRYLSAVDGAHWPAVPDAAGASLMSLLYQLERSQWLPQERLEALQATQLEVLMRHACENVPFYQERRGAWSGGGLRGLPVLARRDLQDNFEHLRSRTFPVEHGALSESRTSGSTGAPVRVLKTGLQGLLWRALTLRDHRWHRRDLQGALAVIRKGAGHGSTASWGPATDGFVETGPCLLLDVDSDAAFQLQWLRRHDPTYLLTYPSLAAELARSSLEEGIKLPGLREVRTLGESLDAETRALCVEAWGVPLVDMYSADEVGYIALQCPKHEHYHVQSESVLVEILDDRGGACAPGEVGRVVVTDLHNAAMPLIRYDIGDYAEAGVSCDCGRGLPVLNRIAGRVRNMLLAPGGRRYWPSSGLRKQTEVPKLRQYQFVQKALDLLEARMVVSQPLTAAEEEYVRSRILSRLPDGMRVLLRYVDAIPRGLGGKYEEFVCEVPRA